MSAAGRVTPLFFAPADVNVLDRAALERFVGSVRSLHECSGPREPWMAGDVFTCDGGALACGLIARAQGIPVRLCVGLYWHTDPALRAALMGEGPDDDDVDGSGWAEYLRWVERNAMDEHHHWVVLWPDSPDAVLVDPNGPERGEPYVRPVGGGPEPPWRAGGLIETYTELPAHDVWRAAVYDPDGGWDQIADAVYPGLRAAVTRALVLPSTRART